MKGRDVGFLALALVALASALAFVVINLRGAGATLRFREGLERIDLALEVDPVAAQDLIEETASYARSASDWLSIIDRSYRAGGAARRAEGTTAAGMSLDTVAGFDKTFDLAVRARRRFPGNEAVAALFTHAAMRSGRSEEAAEAAEALEDERFASVKAEAYLRGGLLWRESPSEWGLLTTIVESRDPADYFLAEEITGERRYRIDGVLLLLAEGEIERAMSELGSVPPSFAPMLGLLVSYDSGDYGALRMYYRSMLSRGVVSATAQLVYADYLLAVGDDAEALAVYGETLNSPDSALAYCNAAVLRLPVDPEGALELVEVASLRYPRDPLVLATHVRLLLAVGRHEEAVGAVSTYRREAPEDGTLAALDVELTRAPGDPPNRIVTRLWSLHERVANPEPVARLLAWYLFGMRDEAGVVEIVSRSAYRDLPWARAYSAAYAAGEGNLTDALELLPSRLSDDWRHRFNRGVLFAALGEHETAAEELSAAWEEVTRETDVDTRHAARVAYRFAASLAEVGREAEASRAAAEAVRLDPSHVDARQLLASLES